MRAHARRRRLPPNYSRCSSPPPLSLLPFSPGTFVLSDWTCSSGSAVPAELTSSPSPGGDVQFQRHPYPKCVHGRYVLRPTISFSSIPLLIVTGSEQGWFVTTVGDVAESRAALFLQLTNVPDLVPACLLPAVPLPVFPGYDPVFQHECA